MTVKIIVQGKDLIAARSDTLDANNKIENSPEEKDKKKKAFTGSNQLVEPPTTTTAGATSAVAIAIKATPDTPNNIPGEIFCG